MSGKYFADGDTPNIIHLSEAGQHALTQCRALGYRIEYTRVGIRIVYPPPNEMQAIAHNLDDFLAITRSILVSHGVDLSPRQSTDGLDPDTDEAFSYDNPQEAVAQLIVLCRRLIEQRDAWKNRAVNAERDLAASKAQGGRAANGDGRYGKLKRVIAQELHPDNQIGTKEKRIKEEIFKVVWRKVLEIEGEN